MLEMPEVILEHRAVLYASGQPFSEVHELYRRQLLSFPGLILNSSATCSGPRSLAGRTYSSCCFPLVLTVLETFCISRI